MAPSDRRQAVLSSQHGEDVSLVLSTDMSVHRAMDWDLSQFVSGVSLGRLSAKEVYSAGHGKDVFGLFPRLLMPEYPKGETLSLALLSSTSL